MRIYTGAGDTGETGLVGDARARKSDPRIEACGAVDELNCCLGLAVASEISADIRELLRKLQRGLFELGAQLATPANAVNARTYITIEHVRALEQAIDQFERELPSLRRFILPGGAPHAALLHNARAVCRRAERRVVTLDEEVRLAPEIIAYLNRLSDLLFVLARLANKRADTPEIEWDSAQTPLPTEERT